MHSILIGEFCLGLFGLPLFGLGRRLEHWMAAAALGAVFMPLTNGASQAIWQAKVAPDVQGRVFSARRMIAWMMDPVTPILAGALADYVTEPLMRSQSAQALSLSLLVGQGPGSGMALQFVFAGVLSVLVVLAVYLFVPVVRNLEDLPPDHDQMQRLEVGAAS